jgi:hypothetical protein
VPVVDVLVVVLVIKERRVRVVQVVAQAATPLVFR